MAAKGRVTSLTKQESIPRLECAAAALGAEFTHHIANLLGWNKDEAVYFSDSSTTLWWIRSDKPLKTYVANRVCLILDYSNATQWKHVSTHENPADIPTRTMSARKLKRNELWQFGPAFLTKPESEWPKQRVATETGEARSEVRDWDTILDKIAVNTERQAYSKLGQFLREVWGRYSGTNKGLTIAAYVYHAIYFLTHGPKLTRLRPSSEINLGELQNECLTIMILQEQASYLPSLITNLENKEEIHRRFAGWRPLIGRRGLVCVSGRSRTKVSGTQITMHQILLTKDMPLTYEIVKWYHEHHLRHVGGVRYLLNAVRDEYWIETGLTIAKRIIRRCSRCQLTKMHDIPYQSAPLHESKWQAIRPFSHLGVDMFGPIEVKIGKGRSRAKRYGIIFTCQFTRAINVEMVMDASGYSCYMAFKRHAATYGQPLEINSDRGSNFQQVRTTLSQAETNWQDAQPLVQRNYPRIKWTMNPPRTPSFGGHFESLVKVIKTVFKTIVKWPKLQPHGRRAVHEFQGSRRNGQYAATDRPSATTPWTLHQ